MNLDNSDWWICRFYFGTRKKSIRFPLDNYKSKETVEIENIDDIFSLSGKVKDALKIASRE